MDPILVSLIVVAALSAIGAGAFAISQLTARRRRGVIAAAFRAALPAASVRVRADRCEAETEAVLYLVKIVPLAGGAELILTNRLYWCRNDDPMNWKRSTKPSLVDGVAAFLDEAPATAKRVVKIALLYPTAHNVTRYLNESDVEVVTPRTSVDGVHFVPFDGLADFFSKRDQK